MFCSNQSVVSDISVPRISPRGIKKVLPFNGIDVAIFLAPLAQRDNSLSLSPAYKALIGRFFSKIVGNSGPLAQHQTYLNR